MTDRNRVFISGLECIENLGGGCLEFVLYVNQEVNGHMERVRLSDTIVMPIEALPDAVGKALMALGRQVLVSANGTVTVTH